MSQEQQQNNSNNSDNNSNDNTSSNNSINSSNNNKKKHTNATKRCVTSCGMKREALQFPMPSSVNCDHRPSPSITVHHHSPPITTVHHHSSPFITIRLPNRRFKSKRLRHGHGLGPGSFVPSWILVILPGELILQVDRTSPPSAAPSVSLPANPRLVPTQPGLKLY